MNAKVAVVAGTRVDTAMGAAYLRARDAEIEIVSCPAAGSPREQQLFQISSDENKRRRVGRIFDDAERLGVRDFFVYCNSLSGAFDFESFAAARGCRVYTPLQVYRGLGEKYARIAVIAANAQSTAGIEKSLYEKNPNVEVMSLGMLDLVCAVEERKSPEEIIRGFDLARLLKFFENNRAECLILGCTHFPWFQKALEERTPLPVINPADVMYENLRRGLGAV